ncbi:hypothetical protein B0I37DRAFT_49074 [Chaetomium sp. MPI-CAGE-AT-0009]|nr:hypothetical protein B0I37DRAFT_49074 [Chaetomium sp. MPI-CAGE-AT-0009]
MIRDGRGSVCLQMRYIGLPCPGTLPFSLHWKSRRLRAPMALEQGEFTFPSLITIPRFPFPSASWSCLADETTRVRVPTARDGLLMTVISQNNRLISVSRGNHQSPPRTVPVVQPPRAVGPLIGHLFGDQLPGLDVRRKYRGLNSMDPPRQRSSAAEGTEMRFLISSSPESMPATTIRSGGGFLEERDRPVRNPQGHVTAVGKCSRRCGTWYE